MTRDIVPLAFQTRTKDNDEGLYTRGGRELTGPIRFPAKQNGSAGATTAFKLFSAREIESTQAPPARARILINRSSDA